MISNQTFQFAETLPNCPWTVVSIWDSRNCKRDLFLIILISSWKKMIEFWLSKMNWVLQDSWILNHNYLVVSMVFRPTFESRFMKSTLTSVSTHFGSFCKPSRGPTSTIRTSFLLLVPWCLMLCVQKIQMLSVLNFFWKKLKSWNFPFLDIINRFIDI